MKLNMNIYLWFSSVEEIAVVFSFPVLESWRLVQASHNENMNYVLGAWTFSAIRNNEWEIFSKPGGTT